MNAVGVIICFLAGVLVTYIKAYGDGKRSVELSENECDLKELQTAKTELEFFRDFSIYLNVECMLAEKTLKAEDSMEEKVKKSALPYSMKQILFKKEWMKYKKKGE